MHDPRRPIHRPDTHSDEAKRLRAKVHQHLMRCTDFGSRDLGINGASFVIMAIAILAAELNELDQSASSKYLTELGRIMNPRATEKELARAETRRQRAVAQLFAALDLAMTKPAGTT